MHLLKVLLHDGLKVEEAEGAVLEGREGAQSPGGREGVSTPPAPGGQQGRGWQALAPGASGEDRRKGLLRQGKRLRAGNEGFI